MPYSSDSGKAYVKSILERYNNLYKDNTEKFSALDIGAGSATYPKFVNQIISKDISWTGIEIWEPYVSQFNLHDHYEDLKIESADTAVPKLVKENRKFDLIFIGDVLEHMTRNTAIFVISQCKHLLTEKGMIFASIPIGEYPQGEYLGNPFEAHVDTWMQVSEIIGILNENSEQFNAKAHGCQENEIGIGVLAKNEVIEKFKPSVAAYMICKNEESFIQRCLESIKGADQIVVADTGSTDSTLVKINEMNLPQLTLKQIYISPWRFDDARNASLSYVSEDIDLCVSIDGDELLDVGFIEEIKNIWNISFWSGKIATRINHSFMTHWNWEQSEQSPNITKHYHERIHSRHGYRWIHPVHEKLIHPNEISIWAQNQLMIQKPDNSKNRSAYGPLLEQAVKEDPIDWRLWSFLSNERSTVGNIQGALDALDQCAKLPDHDSVFVYWRKAALYEYLNKIDLARRELNNAIDHRSELRESHVLLAELLERHGKNAQSEWESALKCINPTLGYLRREEVWSDGWIQSKIKQ